MNYYFDDALLLCIDDGDYPEFMKDWNNTTIINISDNIRFDTCYQHEACLRKATERRGFKKQFLANPQIPTLSIVHENSSDQYQPHFDTSSFIYHLVVLTLLQKPTKINLNNAARIFFSNNDRNIITQIIPSFYPDQITIFWAPRQDNQKYYLVPDDIDNIKKLWAAFKIQEYLNYPPRFIYAIGWFLQSKISNNIEHYFVISVIALECLLTLGRKNKGNQLKKRINLISNNYKEFEEHFINEDEANEIWDVRCQMVHSAEQFDKNKKEYIEKIYSKIDGFLRTFLKKAILDDSFMDIIKTPDSIKKEWPV